MARYKLTRRLGVLVKRAKKRIDDMKVKCDVQEINFQDKKQASIRQIYELYLFYPK